MHRVAWAGHRPGGQLFYVVHPARLARDQVDNVASWRAQEGFAFGSR